MNPCISMLIDNRANRVEDFSDAKALTILGTAEELCEGEKHEFTSLYLQRYPHLREFISDPNCALMKIEVHRYILVSRFQEVVELDMS